MLPILLFKEKSKISSSLGFIKHRTEDIKRSTAVQKAKSLSSSLWDSRTAERNY